MVDAVSQYSPKCGRVLWRPVVGLFLDEQPHGVFWRKSFRIELRNVSWLRSCEFRKWEMACNDFIVYCYRRAIAR